ncbi:MAG: NitT/TauT family transport system substrate-binding protein [Motiliproteus sp.]|jgi:NitT/TauT family transport system substrate-binding protein
MLLLLFATLASAAPLGEIRVAALKFGTLNWELETIRQQKLDSREGFELKVIELAGMSATRTALMSGSADVIVGDWIWVSRQRALGEPLQFVPFSTSIGELLLAPDSQIRTLQQLQGKRIGIAGGPASKGWLLLQARALQLGFDLKAQSEQQYGAPPLLSAALEQGRLDAVITFWHYAARLRAQGYPSLLDLKQVSRELGLKGDLPMLGYVFRQSWAEQYPQRLEALQRASTAAKGYLHDNDSGWDSLRGLMQAPKEATFAALKAGYLEGTPGPLTRAQIDAAETMYTLLYQVGGEALLGDAPQLDRDSFRLAP